MCLVSVECKVHYGHKTITPGREVIIRRRGIKPSRTEANNPKNRQLKMGKDDNDDTITDPHHHLRPTRQVTAEYTVDISVATRTRLSC